MLAKSAVVKESVDQMELVYVTWDFTWRIVQVSLRYGILCLILFWPTVRKIVIKKIFCEFEVEGRKLIPKTNLFKQERSELFMKQSIIIFYNCNRVQRQASTYFLFTAAVYA